MTNGAVVQTGAVVAGHVPVWSGNGQVQDGGTPASGVISGIGIQNNGALALGINSGPITGPFVQYGVAVSSTGAVTISLGGYGGAPAATLSYVINGTTYAFNPAGAGNITGPNTTTPSPAWRACSTASSFANCWPVTRPPPPWPPPARNSPPGMLLRLPCLVLPRCSRMTSPPCRPTG